MKFSVGLPGANDKFVDDIIENKAHIDEVYFSFPGMSSGRGSMSFAEEYTKWERYELFNGYIKRLSENNISLNILFNANCYGKYSQSRALFCEIGDTIDRVMSMGNLKSVTTTSPLVARFVKDNFPQLEVRASVNMEIGSIEGMEYLKKYYDGFYMKREYNRDFDKIKELSAWCKDNGKRLYMLANSGCLNFCSAHNFHDNLVAHEDEIRAMDNAYSFPGVCKEYLSDKENYSSLIHGTNFIRPEDLYKYEPYFETVKLATRVNPFPSRILKSYINAKYSGNILELLEPVHNIYPYIIENGEPLRLKKIEDKGVVSLC